MSRIIQDMNIKGMVMPEGDTEAGFLELFSDSTELEYHDFNRVKVNGIKGYIYTLSQTLSKVRKQHYSKKYNNLTFLSGHAEYAPEQKKQYLFVSDKPMTA
jgi:hypothetical protein